MWCTRWYLPLLLLPIPTAPPYFLLLFLFSLTLHAKPCFYCIVLLSTLFVSSCYWQPFPLDSPLTVPWADNVTTFAEALNSTITHNYTQPLPTVMKAADRCWCDLSTGDFFEPFNVSRWEQVSVERLKDDLERQHKLALAKEEAQATQMETTASGNETTTLSSDTSDESLDTHASSPNTHEKPTSLASRLWMFIENRYYRHIQSSVVPTPVPTPPPPAEDQDATAVPPPPTQPLPLFRKEYDLRPYGVGLTIDFGWSR